MEFVHTFFLAILVSFVGFAPPGMINMTALKRSLEFNRKEALFFVLGAVTIILLQAFVAVTFAKFLVENPQVIANLTYAAIVVFLGIVFLLSIGRPERRSILRRLRLTKTALSQAYPCRP